VYALTLNRSRLEYVLRKAQALVADHELSELLKHQGVEATTKVQIVRDLMSDVAVDGSDEFLETLGHYGRLLALPEIASEYAQFLAQGQKALEVTIKSAYPLSDSELILLESQLQAKYADKRFESRQQSMPP
jgi:F0F1-type ATP synthase, delta subunit (mitochondrial oligomycin sensitivity protein)